MRKVVDGEVITRNGNFFIVKVDKFNHYYTALLLGNARVMAWHRTTKREIVNDFKPVPNYDGKKNIFKF